MNARRPRGWTGRRLAAAGWTIVATCLLLVAGLPPDALAEGPPRIRILGTVQDGGLPHFACTCPHCTAAHTDPARARRVAALALILPRDDGAGEAVYLVDATPDIREQVYALRDLAPTLRRVNRAPVDGILLTHAHIGHYTGLMFLGYESAHTRRTPVWASPAMCAFLSDNGPWSQLVAYENIDLRPSAPGRTIALDAGVTAETIGVPHRDEYADTVGFIVRGPAARETDDPVTVLYVPDTDGWAAWDPPLPAVIEREQIDLALLDGTFFSTEELPGRPVESIGHPLIRDTMDLLEGFVRDGRLAVYFTHLNHSNLALDPGGPAAREIESRGFHVAAEGQELPLLAP